MLVLHGHRKIEVEADYFKKLLAQLSATISGDYITAKNTPSISKKDRTINIGGDYWVDCPEHLIEQLQAVNVAMEKWVTAEYEKRKKKLDAIDALLDE